MVIESHRKHLCVAEEMFQFNWDNGFEWLLLVFAKETLISLSLSFQYRQRFLAHCPLPHFVCSVEITDFTLRCACDFSRAFAAKYPNRPGLRKSKYTEQLTREDITELLTVANPGNPGGPLSLQFRPNWGPKGRKNVFWRLPPPPPLISGTPLSPYLKVWIRDWLKTKDVGKSR